MDLSYVLTMDVFITFWWVVNQPIVAIIFLYASTGYKLYYPILGGVKPLHLHIIACIVSYPWWGDTFIILLLFLFSYSRA